jgi:benzoyl-CoA reductase/2-hydroxyglutaryl-CoA dehydratase subunit BcrC/BadD/HgdB
MVNVSRRRFEFARQLIDEFKVSGVVWYELLCCETYDSESYYFSRKLEEMNVPMLILEADYGSSDLERSKVRMEAMIELIEGGIG